MKVSFTVKDEQDFLYITFTGQYSLEDFLKLAPVVLEEAEKHQHKFVVLNLSAVMGEINDYDRFQLGIVAAETWGEKIKVAVIDRESGESNFAETVAVNRGAWIRSFSDKASGVQWLLSESQRV